MRLNGSGRPRAAATAATVPSMTTRMLRNVTVSVAALTLICASCSSGGSSDGQAEATTTAAAPTTIARPAGPSAKVATLTGGKGIQLLSPTPGPDLDEAGYLEQEYSASGTATAYALAGGAKAFPRNGEMTLTPTSKAGYTTRFVVRRPKNPDDFNGTVVVEWNNVSGGLDVAPDWTYTADEIVRSGFAWVGVSTQMIGIEGGPVAVSTPVSEMGGAGKGIKSLDPARYGGLHHPGDAYSYDIYTQVARALRANTGAVKPLGYLRPEHVLAMGESQSAYALTTYYDGVQPLTGAFDGFLVHSRGGAALPLGEPGEPTDISSAVTSTVPVEFRTDLSAPVIAVETETDVVGILKYLPARQADNAHLRVWEVAGTAHVDLYQLGEAVAKLFACPGGVNAGPDHFVVAAALAKLQAWVTRGTAPPRGDRLRVNAQETDYVRDAAGIAAGGIRTPEVDVPVDLLSGLPPADSGDASVACLLAGSTTPIPAADLAKRYDSRAAYLAAYEAATDKAIDAGFVLPADRQAMLDDAQPGRIPAADGSPSQTSTPEHAPSAPATTDAGHRDRSQK